MSTEYYIVTAQTDYGLMRQVNELLKNGWALQGGISITRGPGSFLDYAQALVRPTAPKESPRHE